MAYLKDKLPAYISVGIFLLLSLLALVFWELQREKSLKKHLSLQADFYSSSVKYVMHTINDLTDLIFYLKIDRDRWLKEVLRKVNRDNMEDLHWEVYYRYKDLYENFMRSKHIRQLHFHLPGAISFVRMHRPEKFGDSLVGVRFSIEKVNKTLKPLKCFEEGRIFNGFRNVYPIMDSGKLLGTVEISYDAQSIEEVLRKERQIDVELWVRKEIVLKKVWEEERENYLPIPGVDNFLLDRETHNPSLLKKEEYSLFWEELSHSLKDWESPTALHKNSITVILIPLKNCKGEFAARLVLYTKDRTPLFISRLYTGFALGSVAFNALFAYLLYTLIIKYRELKESSLKDPLTGVFNRGAFYTFGEKILSLARREGRPVSVVMCDIDHFKRINDTYGHHTGDVVLKEVAQAMSKNLREGDLLARYGGEEFILLLSLDREKAVYVAEKLRKLIENLKPKGIKITCSFGVAQAGEGETLQEVIDRADKAMYKAKRLGRNRVESD